MFSEIGVETLELYSRARSSWNDDDPQPLRVFKRATAQVLSPPARLSIILETRAPTSVAGPLIRKVCTVSVLRSVVILILPQSIPQSNRASSARLSTDWQTAAASWTDFEFRSKFLSRGDCVQSVRKTALVASPNHFEFEPLQSLKL